MSLLCAASPMELELKSTTTLNEGLPCEPVLFSETMCHDDQCATTQLGPNAQVGKKTPTRKKNETQMGQDRTTSTRNNQKLRQHRINRLTLSNEQFERSMVRVA